MSNEVNKQEDSREKQHVAQDAEPAGERESEARFAAAVISPAGNPPYAGRPVAPFVRSIGAGDEEGSLGALASRLIRFGALNRLMQVVLVITIAQLVITGIALAANGGSQPQTITHTTGAGELIQVPLAVYVISLASSVLGWSFLLVASLQSSAGFVRLFLLFFALGLLSAEPVAHISEAALGGTGLSPGQALFPVMQLVALALLLFWGIATSARGGRLETTHNSPRWPSIAVVSALICLYYTMDVIAVLVYDPQASARGFVPSSVATLSTLLPVALAVIVYWASTDFIEWGEAVASQAAALARRIGPPWVLGTLIALLSDHVHLRCRPPYQPRRARAITRYGRRADRTGDHLAPVCRSERREPRTSTNRSARRWRDLSLPVRTRRPVHD